VYQTSGEGFVTTGAPADPETVVGPLRYTCDDEVVTGKRDGSVAAHVPEYDVLPVRFTLLIRKGLVAWLL